MGELAVHVSKVLEKLVTLPLMPPEFDTLTPEVRRLAALETENSARTLARDLLVCESPIEQMMLFILRDLQRFCSRVLQRERVAGYAAVTPQALVTAVDTQYRVDFLFEVRTPTTTVSLVIECDGHDFHERTKEQAARDKSRDRALTSLGHTVLHFTGSEIWWEGQTQLEGDVSKAFFELCRVLTARTGLPF